MNTFFEYLIVSSCLVLIFDCDSKYDRPRKIDLFYDAITSTTLAPPQPKCECMPPQTNSTIPTCIPYDSRLQAASLEEAINAFPDLTITHQEKTTAPTMTNNCKTKQCRDCYKALRSQLRKVGLLPSTINQVFNNQKNFTTCEKYRFTRKDKGVYEMEKKKAKQHFAWNYDDDDYDSDDYIDSNVAEKKVKKKVLKRDVVENTVTDTTSQPNTTALNTTGIIGVRFPISCTTRGVTPDGLNTVALCSTCWVWRRLPSNYYPAYLNEVVCDYSDTSCLSGYASCQTGTQQLNVLRNDSGVLTAVSVSAGINCECRILLGSVLESLVLGNGMAVALPPISSNTTARNVTG